MLIDAAVAAGAQGIVAPGFGSPREVNALERAVERGIVVVQAARAHPRRVDPRDRIREADFVAADDLPAHKARILLPVALTQKRSRDAIQEMSLTF